MYVSVVSSQKSKFGGECYHPLKTTLCLDLGITFLILMHSFGEEAPDMYVLTRGMSHYGLAIHLKKVLQGKRRRIMKTQIFHHAKI